MGTQELARGINFAIVLGFGLGSPLPPRGGGTHSVPSMFTPGCCQKYVEHRRIPRGYSIPVTPMPYSG